MRGVGVMKGYYKNPEEDAQAFTEDGWLRTGDLAEFDEAGLLKIVGRKKEIIVTPAARTSFRALRRTICVPLPWSPRPCWWGMRSPSSRPS